MRIRLATTFAIYEAKAAADAAYDLAGATAIFVGNDFERRFRDNHTVTRSSKAAGRTCKASAPSCWGCRRTSTSPERRASGIGTDAASIRHRDGC